MYIDDRTRVMHMLDAAKQAQDFIQGRKRADLDEDVMLMHALIRVTEIIGEAGRHISDTFKSNHPEIPWIDVMDMRNRLIHGYFKVNLNIVWDTVIHDIPVLIKQLEKILQE